jgi:SAM-dependent methyltransferase
MNRTYWNRMAARYEAEIFSVLAHDRTGLIAGKVRRYGKKTQTATDIGCGIGHFLPLLAGRFRSVLAVDLSAKNIARARTRHAHLPNVSYRTADLSAPGVRLPRADFALCVNVAISPALAPRHRLLDAAARHLRPGGYLVLVVPSLESACLTDFRLIECNLRNGLRPGAAVRAGFGANPKAGRARIQEGIVRIDGVETKHFLKEELAVLLGTRGLRTLEIGKIEYPWATEFTNAPRWMQAPYPWDWLVVARKNP